jgi:hypothetical protein
MRTLQVICFAVAAAVAIGLQAPTPSYAKNLELQNQNKVEAHCAGAGNCRFGDNSTSRPTFSGGTLHGRVSASSFGAGGRSTAGGDPSRGGGTLSGGHAESHGGHGSKR